MAQKVDRYISEYSQSAITVSKVQFKKEEKKIWRTLRVMVDPMKREWRENHPQVIQDKYMRIISHWTRKQHQLLGEDIKRTDRRWMSKEAAFQNLLWMTERIYLQNGKTLDEIWCNINGGPSRKNQKRHVAQSKDKKVVMLRVDASIGGRDALLPWASGAR